jgi:hypothetical protein
MYMNKIRRGKTPERISENESSSIAAESSGTAIKLMVAALSPVDILKTIFAMRLWSIAKPLFAY